MWPRTSHVDNSVRRTVGKYYDRSMQRLMQVSVLIDKYNLQLYIDIGPKLKISNQSIFTKNIVFLSAHIAWLWSDVN